MFNPPPGPVKPGTCKEHPDLEVREPPRGAADSAHAHVNKGGITFACDGTVKQEGGGA